MLGLKKENYISPGSIGGKIRKIREHRGWTQKELGIRCGFSESTADVRIRQYESNQKVPREKALLKITEALGVDDTSLFDADLLVKDRACHALFDLEDFHGLHPVEKDGKYYLEFGGPTILRENGADDFEYTSFLRSWQQARNKFKSDPRDSAEEAAEKRKAYDLWRYEYPINEAKETAERMSLLRRKERLEKELRELKEQLGAE